MRLIVHVEVPALDRLVDFLKEDQQRKIDALDARVKPALDTLKQSTSALETAEANQ